MTDIEKYSRISDEELLKIDAQEILRIEDEKLRKSLWYRYLLAAESNAWEAYAKDQEELRNRAPLRLFKKWLALRWKQIVRTLHKVRTTIYVDVTYYSDLDWLLLAVGGFLLSKWLF